MTRRNLGEFEQIVLLAILKSGSAPYANEIRRIINEVADRDVSRGALYRTFDRLSAKGYLVWTMADDGPVPERGGHPMRCFAVTESGLAALRKSRRTLLELWDGLEAELRSA
ncbi:MAG: PadR family transcriptional regulator [Gemmatimonadetes bacterium]|nr:PadR family transcriptional regulator [Gemmatimonadota bacterium]